MTINPAHLARTTDPDSSHEAAERVSKSTRTQTQDRSVAAAVARHVGQTAAELSTLPSLEWIDPCRRCRQVMITRSLNRLELANQANARNPRTGKPHLERRCKVNGTKALTWWPPTAEPGRLF